jgi:hypothetical protein
MIKYFLALIIFSSQSFAASPIYDFCKSQLKDKTPCEFLMGKKVKNQTAKEWIKNFKKDELEMKKLAQGIDELKKENTLKTNSLLDLQKEYDVAKAQIEFRIEESRGFKGQLDNVNAQLSHQTEENKKLKKSYDEIDRKFQKFSSEYYIQNRITIVLGIFLVLALFLLIKKAKESYNAKKEIAVLRGKLKELSIDIVETEEFPIPDSIIPNGPKENQLNSTPQ